MKIAMSLQNKKIKFNLHHVGVVTNNTENTAKTFIEIGYSSSGRIIDNIQNVAIELLINESNVIIELIEPLDNNSPVFNFLKKNGVCSNHICYEVENIVKVISELKKKKFICLFDPVPAIAFKNRLITYLYHKDAGLIELIESI
jgi:methylmalonyl-CoA/ethylmalonyl-CoA epimerase